jgi:hypothetical protein
MQPVDFNHLAIFVWYGFDPIPVGMQRDFCIGSAARRPSGMVKHRFRPVNFFGLENRMTAQPPPPPPPPPPPGYPPQPPAAQAPKNYLVWSILVTLFCCLVPGIVAIVYSAQVNGLWGQGRYADAQKASDRARTWVIISVVLGIIGIAISIYYATKNGGNTNAAMF